MSPQCGDDDDAWELPGEEAGRPITIPLVIAETPRAGLIFLKGPLDGEAKGSHIRKRETTLVISLLVLVAFSFLPVRITRSRGGQRKRFLSEGARLIRRPRVISWLRVLFGGCRAAFIRANCVIQFRLAATANSHGRAATVWRWNASRTHREYEATVCVLVSTHCRTSGGARALREKDFSGNAR